MKKSAWTWVGLLLLVVFSVPLGAAASLDRPAAPSQGVGTEVRLCQGLMSLGGEGGSEDSMDLPPLKSEKRAEPSAATGLRLKQTAPATEPAAAARREPKAPAAPPGDPPGLSPMILTGSGGAEEPAPLRLKPSTAQKPEATPVAASPRLDMPHELKPLSPAAAPVTGLKIAPSGPVAPPEPVATPDIPLLAEEPAAPKATGKPSSGTTLTLKQAGGSKPAAPPGAYTLGGLSKPGASLGQDGDAKLIAIYEKYYKNR